MTNSKAISAEEIRADAMVKPNIPEPRDGKIFGFLKPLRRAAITRRAMVWAFRMLQKLGISVVPCHFYWPVPNLNDLEQREWPLQQDCPGIDLSVGRQLTFLNETVVQYRSEMDFPQAPGGPAHQYHFNNGLFESVDAELAYAMVRHLRPRRIIEVGGGFSTRLLAAAVLKNRELGSPLCDITCIEPHPDTTLKSGIPGVADLIPKPIQQVPLSLFDSLEADDILFLDSSHIVSIGSDVNFEVLQVLPRLQKGAVVHFHDIFLPSEYPRTGVMESLAFWSEQYLVQAFLAFNPSYQVLWASSAMQLFHSEALEAAFPSWRASYAHMPSATRQFIPTLDGNHVWPSSFWLRKSERPARASNQSFRHDDG
jgi:hypothetical protein